MNRKQRLVMSKFTDLMLSPALPSALLLYGIVFGFATWSYLGWQWQRMDTAVLYGVITAWAVSTLFYRWRDAGIALNRLDVLFGVFLLWVLGSVATHWWHGTIQYLEFMPFFVILPYLLGRMMPPQDVELFKNLLIGMACTLLLLLPFEYWKNNQAGALYENSPAPILFGQGHGTMLAGLLFSAALLALISKLTLPVAPDSPAEELKKKHRFFGYVILAALMPAMIWIASRGPAVALVLGILVLFFFASFISWKKKITILSFLGLSALVAFSISFQNKHHKEYYQLLFMRPATALSSVPHQAPKLEYGKPILGESICKDIPNSISDRWIHYRTAWEIFLAKPWTGVGANFYGFYSCTGPGWFPHTTVLQVLSELGVMGGLLYFSLIGVVFWTIISSGKTEANVHSQANMSWLLAFVVFQFTVSQFNSNYFMSAGLYFVIGLAASLLKGDKENRAVA